MTALAQVPDGSLVQFGSRAVVPFGCGNVCAQAVFAGTDRRTRRPSYAVRIANNSEHQLHARVCSTGNRIESDLDIAPFSITDTMVSVRREGDRAIVQISGDRLRFSLDAAPVTRRPRTIAKLAAMFALIGGGLSLACGSAYYATHASRGVPAPAPATPPVVQIRTVVKRVALQPLLDDLNVLSAVVAGSPLRVRYTALAPGSLFLLDGQGRVWATRPLDPSGETTLEVPESAAGRTLRVVATAHRGAQRAQLAASVIVLPDGSATAQETVESAAGAEKVPDHVASGGVIRVRLPREHAEMTLSVTDANGNVVTQADVAANQRVATLPAPAVSVAAAFDVVVTASNGHAMDTRVHAITVLPATSTP